MLRRMLFTLAAFSVATAAAAESEIGKATSITVEVTGAVAGSARALSTGDRVFEDERIETNSKGVGQFEFLDATRLAIGPRSSVKLDRFVYDRNRKAREVAIELGRGAFRFISGGSRKAAYSLSTNVATIGVRGTTFDLYVADSGALCLAALAGSVRVCPHGRNCRVQSTVGQYLIVTPDRTYWLLDRWDGALLGGVTFAAAMPFLASQEQLRTAFRARETAVARYRATAP